MPNPFITPEIFKFLRGLARNNNREWFARNKDRYHDQVRDPLCAFVEAIGPKLRAISPNVMADSRPIGGSLFRIYRDTRFAKDKSPYKTYAGLSFRTAAKGVPSPSFYLHLAPDRVFAAMGMWHPEADALRAVRNAIVDRPDDWKRAKKIGLDRSSLLTRVPRGFDPDDPNVEDLKLKGFTATAPFSVDQACATDFPLRFIRACRKGKPLVEFVGGAVGVKI